MLDEALGLFLASAPFLAHYRGGHALAEALRCGLIERLSQGTAVHEKLENLSSSLSDSYPLADIAHYPHGNLRSVQP